MGVASVGASMVVREVLKYDDGVELCMSISESEIVHTASGCDNME
jgi:hypothetical protein